MWYIRCCSTLQERWPTLELVATKGALVGRQSVQHPKTSMSSSHPDLVHLACSASQVCFHDFLVCWPRPQKKNKASLNWLVTFRWLTFYRKKPVQPAPLFFFEILRKKKHFYKKVVANQSNLLEKRDSWINNTNASISWNCFLPREVIHAGPMDHCCHRHLRRYRRNTSLAHRKRAGLGWVQRWKFTP